VTFVQAQPRLRYCHADYDDIPARAASADRWRRAEMFEVLKMRRCRLDCERRHKSGDELYQISLTASASLFK
jgi:hypothetical protein